MHIFIVTIIFNDSLFYIGIYTFEGRYNRNFFFALKIPKYSTTQYILTSVNSNQSIKDRDSPSSDDDVTTDLAKCESHLSSGPAKWQPSMKVWQNRRNVCA